MRFDFFPSPGTIALPAVHMRVKEAIEQFKGDRTMSAALQETEAPTARDVIEAAYDEALLDETVPDHDLNVLRVGRIAVRRLENGQSYNWHAVDDALTLIEGA